MYAQVIVRSSSHNIDRPFHYQIPKDLLGRVVTGTRVAVPFGVSNRLMEGCVVGVSPSFPEGLGRIKNIAKIIDPVPLFSEELVQLGEWMRWEYMCTWSEALQCIIPPVSNSKGIKYLMLGKALSECHRLPKEHRAIAEAIEKAGGKLEAEKIKYETGIEDIQRTLARLIEEGYVIERYDMEYRVKGKYEPWAGLLPGAEAAELPPNAIRMRAILEYFKRERAGEAPCRTLREQTGCSFQTLRSLEKRGIIRIYDKREERIPHMHTGLVEDRVVSLTPQQEEAVKGIPGMYGRGVREVLIHGVTGSGKTEVYMRLIGDAIERGRKAIVLVPEISLTPQMVEWYHRRFENRAALFHSRLSPGERYDQWEGIRKGRYDVAIGARSAVFAPFEDIGLIIIDEEHEHTYKSEYSPKYVTRDVARKRCLYFDGLLVMGSATPSVETYRRAETGEIGLVELKDRVGNSALPRVEIVDMREELKRGNRSIFSARLKEEIEKTMGDKQQIILLLNRRGFSNFISCRDCGSVIKCANCDISLTYHRADNRLICHYCGFSRKLPQRCDNCGSSRIRHMGSGTEKLEREVGKYFPGARVLRMDVDTTRRKDSHYNILKAFKNREGDILLGTQMVAKGLDFPSVTLVGVILADFSLNIPDFRAAERTFQLLTQVSGRAGRGDIPGKVIVQTYSPDHYSVRSAQSHDYNAFYADEVSIRERFGYPPFTRLIKVLITGGNLKEVVESGNRLFLEITDRLRTLKDPQFEVFGPSPALHSRIKGRYRWQIIIKGTEMDIIKKEVRNIWLDAMQRAPKDVNIIIDIDPYSLM